MSDRRSSSGSDRERERERDLDREREREREADFEREKERQRERERPTRPTIVDLVDRDPALGAELLQRKSPASSPSTC
jgi:hypothetical protein